MVIRGIKRRGGKDRQLPQSGWEVAAQGYGRFETTDIAIGPLMGIVQ